MIKNKNLFLALAFGAALALMGGACSSGNNDNLGTEKDEDYNKTVVISEVMADNVATITDKNGKAYAWVEIENVSDDDVSLDDLSLLIKKDKNKDKKKSKKKDKAKKEDNDNRWYFPDIELEPGQRVVVLTGAGSKEASDKNDDDDQNKQIVANIELPRKNGHVVLLSSSGKALSEAKYTKLHADEALARNNDGSMASTCMPTPGFPNTKDGFEAFMKQQAKQRNSALQLWKVRSKGNAAAGEQWVVLKNTSSADINLKDYCLTNKADKLDRWHFADTKLAPGAFYTVKLMGKKKGGKSDQSANFKLGDSESVALTKGGKIVDGISAFGTPIGGARGRMESQPGLFFFADTTSAENGAKGYRYVASQPSVSKAAGVYDDKTMTVEIDGHGQKVRYTLDGSKPTSSSNIYNGPIKLSKSATVRCYAEGDAQSLHSEVLTSTYLLGEKHSLPVLHITIRNSDLYDPSNGIYVEGNGTPRYVTRGAGENEYKENLNANFMKNWAKPAHAEFFDGDDGFSVDCALKITGAGSRYLPKKSMSLKFDIQYGPSSVVYDFFATGKPIELQDIVLRSGSTDQVGVMMRDEFFTSLMGENSPSLLTQAFRPIAIYVNNEYWGLYYFREKVDNNFVARHLGVSNDDINIMCAENVERGSDKEYLSLLSYVRSQNMKTDNAFNYINQRVDLVNLIDQKIGEMYCGNTDIYNVREVQSPDKAGDRKWHFVFYDVDESWMVFKAMGFYLREDYSQGVGSQPVRFCNGLIDHMLSNPKFRQMFLERLSYHMHNTFSYNYITKKFDNIINAIKPEMPRNCKRWPDNMSYESWTKRVASFRKKFKDRGKEMLDGIRKELNVTKEENNKYFKGL